MKLKASLLKVYEVWEKIKLIVLAILNSVLIKLLPEDLMALVVVIVNSVIAIVDAVIKYIQEKK